MRRHPVLLIVEDDPVLRELYRVEMSVARFDVHVSEDGLRALQFLDQQRPDLIVLDLNLPRVSGIDIFQELRAHAATRDIPIIVCTGADPIPDLPGAIVLRKPCAAEELVVTATQALEPRRTAWLFVRGDQSVRLVRESGKGRHTQLLMFGPGRATAEFFDEDPANFATRMNALERSLVAEGYVKLPLLSGDRREGDDRRAMRRSWPPDRRTQPPVKASE